MKLILAIISNEDSGAIMTALTKEGYSVTKLSTTGGFLSAGNTTLLIGTEEEKVEHAIELIGQEGKQRKVMVPTTNGYDMSSFTSIPVEVVVGGATVFVLNVEEFRKL